MIPCRKGVRPAEEPAIPIDTYCTVTPADCIELFKADLQYGLTKAQVEKNREAYGGNKLPELTVDPIASIALEQLSEPLNYVRATPLLRMQCPPPAPKRFKWHITDDASHAGAPWVQRVWTHSRHLQRA